MQDPHPYGISPHAPREYLSMLALFRRSLDTWPARIFLILLVGLLGLWGVSGAIGDIGRNDGKTVAEVGSTKVGVSELQDASRRMLAQLNQQNGGKLVVTPEIRRGVAQQALQQLVVDAAIANEAQSMHIVVPDPALRQALMEAPGFQGLDGKFDRARFEQAWRSYGPTEDRFLALMRNDLAQRQIVEAVRAGGSSPEMLNRMVYQYQGETRTADLVALPFAGAPDPSKPTEDQLARYFADTSDNYTLPEMRRIQAVILSPESVARDITVSAEDARAWFEAHRAEFERAETRSVQVIIAPTEAAGRTLATAWAGGAAWTAMQAQAAAGGATALDLPDTSAAALPSPDLARAVFAAPPNQVTGPLTVDSGFPVFRVTKIVAGTHRDFAAAEAEVRGRVALERGAEIVYERSNKLQDALAGGAKLEELPADLGLLAVQGTLDAQGNTADGTPAPIPGPPELRAKIVARAFAMTQGEEPQLEDAGTGTFYAVAVESITPPAQQTLADVRARVVDDWTRDQRRHAQDVVAAGLLTAVKGGGSLADAATLARVPMRRTPPIGMAGQVPGVPAQLIQPLFSLRPGQGTMVETPDGFYVAALVGVQRPDPGTGAANIDLLRTRLAGSMADDIEQTFAGALRDRERVTVNGTLFDTVARP